MRFEETPQLYCKLTIININLSYKGTVVNPTSHCINRGSHKVTSTVSNTCQKMVL